MANKSTLLLSNVLTDHITGIFALLATYACLEMGMRLCHSNYRFVDSEGKLQPFTLRDGLYLAGRMFLYFWYLAAFWELVVWYLIHRLPKPNNMMLRVIFGASIGASASALVCLPTIIGSVTFILASSVMGATIALLQTKSKTTGGVATGHLEASRDR